MVTFYIPRAFQQHLTHPNPSSNEEVMVLTNWIKKTVATEKTLSRQSHDRENSQRENSVAIEKTLSRQRKLYHNRENFVTTEKLYQRNSIKENSIATEKLCRNRENSVTTKMLEKTKKDRKLIFWLVFKPISP